MTSLGQPQTPPLYTPRAKNLALLLLAMTQFVIVIDASIVNVALPSIGAHLHFARADLSWVVNAYTLTFGGFLLLGGRLADLLGRRRMFMLGLVLFSVASFAGGIAQSEGWLIAARAVQGLGAAIVSPAALSIITTTFAEGAERNRALGIWGAVAGAGGAAGVLLGGILTSGLSWRWVLFVNVPIGIAAALLAPADAASRAAPRTARATFDLPGAVTVTAGLSLLVYAIVDAVNVGLGLDDHAAATRRRRRPAGRVPGHRAAPAPSADAVLDLPPADAARREHRRAADRHVAVLDVLLHLAVPPGRPALLADQDGHLLPAAGGRDHRVGRSRVAAGDAHRLQAAVDRRAAADRRRAAVVLPGAGTGRLVRRRRARPVAAGRRRARVRVRAGDDRRGDAGPSRTRRGWPRG